MYKSTIFTSINFNPDEIAEAQIRRIEQRLREPFAVCEKCHDTATEREQLLLKMYKAIRPRIERPEDV